MTGPVLLALAALAASPAPAPVDPAAAATPAAPAAWAPVAPPPPLARVPARAGLAAPVEARLASGLRVVVVERHRRPVVIVRLVLPRGAATDPPRQEGATWLAVHLASDYRERSDQGERLAGEKSLRREVGELGGALSVDVDPDRSVLGVSGYARDARRYLSLLADAVTAPRHGSESFAARRGALLDAIDELESSDPEALAQVVTRAAFGTGHPYARSVIGTRRSLGPIGLEDVVVHQEGVLAPAGATLLVVGDVRAEQVIADARKLFGRWQREAVPAPAIAPPAPPRGPFDAGMLRRQPASTLVACATRPVSDVRATDGALAVFAALLGEGARSRLALALREEGGFTYHAGAAVVRQRAARALVACTPLAAARAGEGLRAFRGALEALRGGVPAAEELRRAKALRLAALEGAQEDVEGEAGAWTEALSLGLRAPRRAEEAAEIERTTGDEVRRIAAAALRPEGLRWIFSGDPAVAARAVRENGLGRLLGLPLDR